MLWKQIFSCQSRARIIQLRSQLQTTRKGATGMAEFLFRMKNIANNLSLASHLVSEDDLLLYIMSALGPEYDSVVINVTTRQNALSLEEIQFLILNQEQRIEQQHNIMAAEVTNAIANFGIGNNVQQRSETTLTQPNG